MSSSKHLSYAETPVMQQRKQLVEGLQCLEVLGLGMSSRKQLQRFSTPAMPPHSWSRHCNVSSCRASVWRATNIVILSSPQYSRTTCQGITMLRPDGPRYMSSSQKRSLLNASIAATQIVKGLLCFEQPGLGMSRSNRLSYLKTPAMQPHRWSRDGHASSGRDSVCPAARRSHLVSAPHGSHTTCQGIAVLRTVGPRHVEQQAIAILRNTRNAATHIGKGLQCVELSGLGMPSSKRVSYFEAPAMQQHSLPRGSQSFELSGLGISTPTNCHTSKRPHCSRTACQKGLQ